VEFTDVNIKYLGVYNYIPIDSQGEIHDENIVHYGTKKARVNIADIQEIFTWFASNSQLRAACKFFKFKVVSNPAKPSTEAVVDYIKNSLAIPFGRQDHGTNFGIPNKSPFFIGTYMQNNMDVSYLTRQNDFRDAARIV
jgi:hypothetical protein